jgi:hypothetical protein
MCALEMPGGKPYQQQTFSNMRASTILMKMEVK